VVFTTTPARAELQNGLVCSQVRSWLTGRRFVSVPFSDHCEPLVGDADQFQELCAAIERERSNRGSKYVELRPVSTQPDGESTFVKSEEFCLHTLDLRPSEEALFRAFHKDSTQRKVRRAIRERLVFEDGRSERLLSTFYKLLVQTRRRHGVPAQPFSWFRNLAACLGPAMVVSIASYEGLPVAGIVTLTHQLTVTYKYGASDPRWHRLGGMHLLLWRTILAARSAGCITLDLGRTSLDNGGLLTFKDRWGAARSTLTYWRSPGTSAEPHVVAGWIARALAGALQFTPAPVGRIVGTVLHRHVG
jgi:hypothetical protein